jgi:O-antigen ligase
MACALAASIPNDAALALVAEDLGRSPSYYVGIAAVLASLPVLPRIVRAAVASLPLMLVATAAAFPVLLWAVSGSAGASTYDASTYDRPFKFAYIAALVLWVGRDPVWRRRLVGSYIAGWGLFSIVVLYMLGTGRANVLVHYEATRRAVLGMNENQQSVIAASGIVLLIPMAFGSRGKLRGLLIVAGLVLGSAAFVLGASRTATAGLAAGVLFTIVGLLRCRELGSIRRVVAAVFATSAALLVVAAARPSSPVFEDVEESVTALGTRIQAALSGDDLGKRDEISRTTLEVFLDNPLGVGYGGTYRYIGGDPHNSYLKIAAEGGIVATLLLVAGLTLIARNVFRALRRAELVGPAAAFVLFSVTALAGQAIHQLPYWFFVSFVALSPGSVAPGARRGEPDASPDVARLEHAAPFCPDAPR